MISAVILATQRADRIGEHRLLQPVLDSAIASDLHEIVCVVRDLEVMRRKISLVAKRLYWLTNHAADQGESSSIIAGLWAIDPKSNGALFLAGDQPMIRPELINSLVERFENTNAIIVAPSFRGEICNPILFRRDLFPKLLQLNGDRDGRELIAKYRKKTSLVEWNDEGSFKDIDIGDDYEKIKAGW
jgi:molybdenum cofactor cytidylyltransferase